MRDDISYIAENGSVCIHKGAVISRGTIEDGLAFRILNELKRQKDFEIVVSREDTCLIEDNDPAFVDLIVNVMKNTTEIAEDINDIAETAAELSDAETLGESFIVVSSDGEGIDTELTLARANAIKAQDIRSQLVAYAKQFVGGRYRYGGTSLQNGVDCSGFVMNIFGHFGLSTGRDSRTQAANSRTISLSEIQPGDLLFYSSGGRIDHVAIYIGDGLIVHAANAKKGITISNMYYRTPVKAGRFL